MAFRLRPNEYFFGLIYEPDGEKELVAVDKATRAKAVKITVIEAERRSWDWYIQLRRDLKDDEDVGFEVLGCWSSVEGSMPPLTRAEVPGLS